MVCVKVKYCYSEDEVNEVLKQFNPKIKQFPALGKISYLDVNGQLVAIVEYIIGDEPMEMPPLPPQF